MDWAREIRGTNSSENAVTPAAAAASIFSPAVVGDKNEIVIAPDLRDLKCAALSG
jgi:hypothetical protein